MPDSSTGQPVANGKSWAPVVSADGHYTVFLSDASNLVNGDTNGETDVFLRDDSTQKVTRVTNGFVDQFSRPTISGDGTKIAYTVVLPYPDGGLRCEVAVVSIAPIAITYARWALSDSQTVCIENPTLSADGSVVAWEAHYGFRFSDVQVARQANNFYSSPPRTNGTLTGFVNDLNISPDGITVLFDSDQANFVSGDTNGTYDVFNYIVPSGTVGRVSKTAGGAQANGLSAYGKFCVSSFPHDSYGIVYSSFANNIVANDTNGRQDIFYVQVSDTSVTTSRIVAGNGDSSLPSCSSTASGGDGARYVSFVSKATNLVPNDTNNAADVFVLDRHALAPTPPITRTSVDYNLNQANGVSTYPQISANGRWATYESDASNLVGGDTNGTTDVFTSFTLRPTITSVSPSHFSQGVSNVPISITGTGFISPASLIASDGSITFSNVSVVDENHITATISVPAGAQSSPTLFVSLDGTPVTTSSGAAGQCNCFTTS